MELQKTLFLRRGFFDPGINHDDFSKRQQITRSLPANLDGGVLKMISLIDRLLGYLKFKRRECARIRISPTAAVF